MTTLSTLDISNLGSSDERIAARRTRAEAKLKQDKEEAEGKKTKKDDAAEQAPFGLLIVLVLVCFVLLLFFWMLEQETRDLMTLGVVIYFWNRTMAVGKTTDW